MKTVFSKSMSILIALSMTIALCVMLVIPTSAETPTPWDGSTTDTTWYNSSETSFTLTTPQQLAGLASIVNGTGVTADTFAGKTVTLGADIYLNDPAVVTANYVNTKSGLNKWIRIGKTSALCFNGTFDGNGKTIYGMWDLVDAQNDAAGIKSENQGLFGYVGTGEIKNLAMNNSFINVATHSISNFGIIAGSCNGKITNCNVYNSGIHSTKANTKTVAVIAGSFGGTEISGCNVDNFTMCFTSTGGGPAGFIVGGVGNNMAFSVSDCVVTNSKITQTYNNQETGDIGGAGGICGTIDWGSYLTIKDCYVLNVDIDAGSSVGGFLGSTGSNPFIYIDGCMFLGSLSASGKDINPVNVEAAKVDNTRLQYYNYNPVSTSPTGINNNAYILTDMFYNTNIGGAVGYTACTSGSGITIINSSITADITVNLRTAYTPSSVALNTTLHRVNAGGIVGYLNIGSASNFSNNNINVNIDDMTAESVYNDIVDNYLSRMTLLRNNLSTICNGKLMPDGITTLQAYIENNILKNQPTYAIQKNYSAVCGFTDKNVPSYIMSNLIRGSIGSGIDNFGTLFGRSIISDSNVKTANNYCLNSFTGSPDVAFAPEKDYGTEYITSVNADTLIALNNRTGLATVKAKNSDKIDVLPTYIDWTMGADSKINAASITLTDKVAINLYSNMIPVLYVPTVEVNGIKLTGTSAEIDTESFTKYTTAGINAADMNDELTVCVKLAGTTVDTITYSVLKYAANMYKKADTPDDMKALIVGMMYYGDAAQTAKGETATLMGAFETATGYTASETYVTDGYTALGLTKAATVTTGVVSQAALTTDGNVQVVFTVASESATPATVTFLGVPHTYDVTDGQFITNCLYATSLRSIFTVTIGEVSTEYSISNYIVDALSEESTLTDEQKTLAQSLAVYMNLVSVYANANK